MNGTFDGGGPPERDDLIARALARRTPPAHGPEFWAELNRAMVAGAADPVRARDPRFRARVVGAAAMVALVAGAGALLMSRVGDDPVVTAGPASTLPVVLDDRGVASSEATATDVPTLPASEVATTIGPGGSIAAPPTSTAAQGWTTVPPTTVAMKTDNDSGLVSTTLGPPMSLPPMYDGAQPEAGERLSVIGLPPGTALDVRVGPDVGYGVTGSVGSGAVVQATGRSIVSDGRLWYQIVGYDDGWLPASALAAEGRSSDITDELVDVLASISRDSRAIDRTEVVALLAAARNGAATLSVVDDDGVDPGVTVDLLAPGSAGYLIGERLYLVLDRSDDGWWVVLAAESVPLCSRGITKTGECREP